MFCARCGGAIGARAVVCLACGADLTRAGALRMTSGRLEDWGDGLGLPEEILRRHQDEVTTRTRPRQPPPAGSGTQQHGATPAQNTQAQPPAAADEQPTSLPAAQAEQRGFLDPATNHSGSIAAIPDPDSPHDNTPRKIGLVVAALVLVAAMAIVVFLATRFMNLSPGRATPQPSGASTAATPTPTPKPSPKTSAAPTTKKPSPTPTRPADFPKDTKKCSETVAAGPDTSCGTALVMEQLVKGRKGTFTIDVKSPITGRTFQAQCTEGKPFTICDAGRAKAWIRN